MVKFKKLAAVTGACVALFASIPAQAYVYSVAKLDIKDLDIKTFAAGTAAETSAATNYSFTLTNSASYTTPGNVTVNETYTRSCKGVVLNPNGTLANTTNCSVVSPVLDAPVANAPTLSSSRADNNFNALGNLSPLSYSNADSQVSAAKLVQGGTTATTQIAESLLNINGTAFSSTEVKSNTTLITDFFFTGATDLTVDFKAALKLAGEIYDGNGGVYTSQANSSVVLTLTSNDGYGAWTYQPNGSTSFGCFGQVTDGVTISSCAETLDGFNLFQTPSKTVNNSFYNVFTAADADYKMKISNLVAGSYSLALVATTSTFVDRSYIPEPASLALVGVALLGLGAVSRRVRKQ